MLFYYYVMNLGLYVSLLFILPAVFLSYDFIKHICSISTWPKYRDINEFPTVKEQSIENLSTANNYFLLFDNGKNYIQQTY